MGSILVLGGAGFVTGLLLTLYLIKKILMELFILQLIRKWAKV